MDKTKQKTSVVTSILVVAALIWLLALAVPGSPGSGGPLDASRQQSEGYQYLNSPPVMVSPIVTQANAPLSGLYVKFENVDGESNEVTHLTWSDAITFSQGQILPDVGGETRRGDALVEPLIVVKELDKASPKLAEAVFKGKVFPKVEIHLTAVYGGLNRVTYYAYELKNGLVTSYHIGSNEYGGMRPVETISLTFEEIKVTYVEHDAFGNPKGTVQYTWNMQ